MTHLSIISKEISTSGWLYSLNYRTKQFVMLEYYPFLFVRVD